MAIVDFVSDVELLRDIQDTRDNYDQSQEYLASVAARDEYEFGFCHPTMLQPTWYDELYFECDCVGVNVACENGTRVVEQVSNVTADNITADYAFVDQLVSSVSCQPYLWAQGYDYAASYTFDDWSCSYCQCPGNLYNTSTSFPRRMADDEYTALYDQQPKYCDPDKMLDAPATYNDYLDDMIIACYFFVVVGALSQCFAMCIMSCMIKDWSDHDATGLTPSEKLDFDKANMALNFFVKHANILYVQSVHDWIVCFALLLGQVSLFEDMPQTIVAMYYLQFLYVDDGYSCYQQFADYPAVYQMSIDPQQSLLVTFAENPKIAFAVGMSVLMIVYGGLSMGFKVIMGTLKVNAKSDDKVQAVCMVILATFMYVFTLLTPIAAVAKFGIAPQFGKEWTFALAVFIIGIIPFGLICCGGCIFFVRSFIIP